MRYTGRIRYKSRWTNFKWKVRRLIADAAMWIAYKTKAIHEDDLNTRRRTEMFRDLWFSGSFDEHKIRRTIHNAECSSEFCDHDFMTLAELFGTYFFKEAMEDWIYPGE